MSQSLPVLAPCAEINRPLTAPEYYHACIGSSRHTLEVPREVIFVLEGRGRIDPWRYREALEKLVAVHPGLRLHMQGARRQARWASDGQPIRLRVVPDQGWDGSSEQGAGFIQAEPLRLRQGPSSELLLEQRASGDRLIFRTLHAVMDGKGVMHVLQELFRALRGEALLGCNGGFGDTELMRAVGGEAGPPHERPCALSPADAAGVPGELWRRLTLTEAPGALLGRTAAVLAAWARQSSVQPVVIAVPVDLRRHHPGLLTTCNMASMVHVELGRAEGAGEFKRKLAQLLRQRADAFYWPALDWIKLLPLPWFDRLVSRTPGNFRRRRVLETVVISNLGRYEPASLSAHSFVAQALYGVPIPGNSFCFLFGLGERVELVLGMPRVLGAGGVAEALLERLRVELGRSSQPQPVQVECLPG